MNQPWFSIVVSVYNRPREILRCIDSCLSQSFDNFELIVVDDASEDETVAAVLSRKDDRLRLVRHEVNKGMGAARNTGNDTARGRWIIRLDSDFALAELNERRKDNLSLHPAVVVKVNPSEYEFTDPKAIYGVGESDGLVILRSAHEEAVIHEIGHMLGISSHCDKSSNCVMKWECPSKNFCESCAAKLKGLWYYTEPQ